MWDRIENIFKAIFPQNDIATMITIEIIDYLKAMEKAEIANSYIINNSEQSLWFSVNVTICKADPESKIVI